MTTWCRKCVGKSKFTRPAVDVNDKGNWKPGKCGRCGSTRANVIEVKA